jgi:hypothetical protein
VVAVTATDQSVTEESRTAARPLIPFAAAFWAARLLVVAQLAWLMGFSTVEYRRDALTFDFATWNQARQLIVNGHLNPFSTLESMPFWQVNGNWLLWPLAELTRLPPHALILLWFQDLAIFGCAWVVLDWVAQAATGTSGRHSQWRLSYKWCSPLSPAAAVLLVAVLFVANPWVYWSAAFDFHWELPAAFFALLAAWDLARGRLRRLWIWVLLTLATSDVSALYLVGIGVAGLLAYGKEKERRRTSGLILVSGVAWLGFMTLIHANRGSILTQAYAYLAGSGAHQPSLGQIATGAVTHPSRPLSQLWSNAPNFWANLSSNGLLGVFTPWGVGALVSVLIPSSLWNGHAFSVPSYQNFPAYPFVILGTVLVLGRLGAHVRLARHAARPLALVVAGLAIGWAWVWLPLYPSTWLAVSPSGGRALAEVRSLIPANAEVVASNGVVGRLAGRAAIYMPWSYPIRLPVRTRPMYFVLSTSQGIAYASQETEGIIAQLSGMGAQLLIREAGIFVFRWNPPPGDRSLLLSGAEGGVPAWLFSSGVGTAQTNGPPITWRVDARGRAGVVIAGDYWTEAAGQYVATVSLAEAGPVGVQVLDRTTGSVLSTGQFVGTSQRGNARLSFSLKPLAFRPSGSGLAGRGLFKVENGVGPRRDVIEVRVINPGRSTISVYTVAISPAESP